MVIRGTIKYTCFFLLFFSFILLLFIFNILQLCIDMYKYVYVTGQILI